jgi:uncharacterized membrane protein YGL010W
MLYIGSIIAWVAGVVVLIKLFQKEGLLKGILGLICMLYTFIWGWQNIKNDPSLKNWMYVWTALIVLGYVVQFMAGGE